MSKDKNDLMYISANDKRKVKRTIDASSAGLVGILLIVGILFTILVLNSGVSSVAIASAKSDAPDSSADQTLKGAPDAHKPKLKDTRDAPGIQIKSIWKKWK